MDPCIMQYFHYGRLLYWFLLSSSTHRAGIVAQEENEEVVVGTEEATNTTVEKELEPSPDVVTSFVFPDSPELKRKLIHK